MIVSLNEIESLATKAARGVGLAWGMAEEVGFAARWLAVHDLDGVAAVDALLALPDDRRGGVACPIDAGTRLSGGSVRELPWTSQELASPLLLLPFAAQLADNLRAVLIMAWDGALIEIMPGVDGGQVAVGGDLSARRAVVLIEYRARSGDSGTRALRNPRPGERMVDDAAWARLSVLEARTYVPASTRSRESGAGAGLIDND
jgi:hypothetical protein